jgi:hypothetical protein
MSNDVLITPASRKIEFKDASANIDAKIETDASGNLLITNTGGDISIGDTTSDIFVGDGTNNIDIVFEQDGEIRGTSGVTVTLGQSDSNVRMATDLNLNSNDITNAGSISSGAITTTGKFIQDANGAVNSLEIHDDTASGQPGIYIIDAASSPTKQFFVKSYGSSVVSTIFGSSIANKSFVGTGGSSSEGLLLGTLTADPLIIGTNNAAKITIPASGDITFHSQNLSSIGTINSGGITSSAGITANGPFKSGGSNNYILFDYDGDFTGGNYYAIQDTSANRLRISYGFSATDNLELDSSGNFYVNGGNATFAGTISSGAITSSGALTVNKAGVSLANQPSIISTFDSSGTDGLALISIEHLTNSTAAAMGAGLRFQVGDGSTGTADKQSYIFQRGGSQLPLVYIADRSHEFYVDHHDNNIDGTSYADYGTLALTLSEAGNVGIGTTSPTGLLHLKGDTNSNGSEIYLQVNNNNTTDNLGVIHFGNNIDSTLSKIVSGTSGANNSSYLTFSTSSTGTQSERMRIQADGTTTIGRQITTTYNNTIGYALHIQGAAGTQTYLAISVPGANSGDTGVVIGHDGGGTRIINREADPIIFHTNSGSETMRLTSDGKLGIGTPSPGTNLHVGTTGGNSYSTTITKGSNMKGGVFTQASNGNDMVGVYFATGTTAEGTHWSGITGSRSNNASHWGTQLNFYTHNDDQANLNDATQKMVLDGSGNLYIGSGSQGAAINQARVSAIHNTIPAARFAQASTSNGLPCMRVRHENSTAGNYIEFRTDENVLTGIIQDVSGTMAYQSASDSRLKENVESMSEGLTEVLAMNPVKFTWKDIVTENKTVDMEGAESRGFLAQELNEQYPWAVSEGGEDEKEKPWSVDYGKLTPILVKAIQEQQTLIESLEARIAALES